MAVGSSDPTTTPLFFIIAVSWNETFDQPNYRAFRTTRASELYRTIEQYAHLQIPTVCVSVYVFLEPKAAGPGVGPSAFAHWGVIRNNGILITPPHWGHLATEPTSTPPHCYSGYRYTQDFRSPVRRGKS